MNHPSKSALEKKAHHREFGSALLILVFAGMDGSIFYLALCVG